MSARTRVIAWWRSLRGTHHDDGTLATAGDPDRDERPATERKAA